jgi:hypothetical protein
MLILLVAHEDPGTIDQRICAFAARRKCTYGRIIGDIERLDPQSVARPKLRSRDVALVNAGSCYPRAKVAE